MLFEDGTAQGVRLPVNEARRTFAVPRRAALRTVRVDPGFGLLAELTLTGPTGWLVAMLEDPCPIVALRAATALLKSDKRAAVEAVWKARKEHPFAPLRAVLAERLGARRGDDTRDRLVAALEDPDPIARRGVATALGDYRDAAAASGLITALQAPCETWQLHGALCHALGRTRDDRATELLRAQLQVDSWAETVRRGALMGLAATSRAEVLPDLLQASLPDAPERVRIGAAAAMAVLAENEESVRRAVVDRLMEMLGEPGLRPQLAAIDALGATRDRRAEGPLALLHRSAPDGRTRRQAYEAMQRINRSQSDPVGPLRARVDELVAEVGRLRSRLDRLEPSTPLPVSPDEA
jgi:HEAT repeat protein